MNSVNAAITQVPSEQGGIDIVGYESSINTDNWEFENSLFNIICINVVFLLCFISSS